MAAAAETLIQTHQQTYISADSLPELAALRDRERYASQALMRSRELSIQSGEHSRPPVDALSTGYRALEARNTYKEYSPEYAERRSALVKDCKRLIAEWRRKNKPEYFEPTHHILDEQTGEFIADGHSSRQINLDGLIPTAYKEEDARRVNESVEEATSMHARRLGGFALGQTIRMRTVSECTDWAIEGYKRDNKSHGGYVPEIQKLIVRDMVLDPESNGRYQEQVGLPGIYINHYVIQQSLARREFYADNLDKTQLHGTQLFTEDDIFDFVALLDEVASEEWCTEIFMGEKVEPGTTKNYEVFRQEAIERQRLLDADSEMTADFVMSLCEAGTDEQKAPELVEEFVKNLLITKAQADPEITMEMFDANTAKGLLEVEQLHRLGQIEEAQELLLQVVAEAPGGGYCGAGSCELERANIFGEEATKIKKLGLDPKDTLVDKGDRKCVCGKRTVVYDLKQKTKGCLSCGKTKKY